MASSNEHIYFVGIGGAGMSGIARILMEQGYAISGSDLKGTNTTERLEVEGAVINIGHAAENVTDNIDLVVVSTAIPPTNAEVMAAHGKNIPVISRGEMLARIMDQKRGIAVAGAHGKTTTTSMIALVLEKNNLDPTVVVGGELNDIGSNAKMGAGEYLVAEADESDGSFLKLNPQIAVVTNIEADHLDYHGSLENIIKAFNEFIAKLPTDGLAVLCVDNENVRDIASHSDKNVITYGINVSADYMARNIRSEGLKTRADIYNQEKMLGQLELNVPGRHNMTNALAAIVIGLQLGIKFADIATALNTFRGVHRRFDILGQVDGIRVIDDYAHHPTEVAATLAAAQQTMAKRVISVFQPHRYTRTKFLHREFGEAFTNADVIIINEIYSAGEKPIEGVSAELIVQSIPDKDKKDVYYIKDMQKIADFLLDIAREGDLILTMGAGNIRSVGVELVGKLKAR